MTSQSTSVVERLREAESPDSLPDWEKQDGYYIATCRVSTNDVPSLIDIARKWLDPRWPNDDFGVDVDLDEVELLPVTAWRALADLKSSESVQPLIDMLCALDGDPDDWATIELPHVFGKIGQPAINALAQLASDSGKEDDIRSIAAKSLRRVAEYHAATRDHIVSCLTAMMTSASPGDIQFNSGLLVDLVELCAVEAAEAIERAFANNLLDIGMIGDWEEVRRRLGVEGLGLEMPSHPHNSIEELRTRMGIGIFSDKPIFDHGFGEPIPEAEQAYYERAWKLFSKSNEGQQVVDRFGSLGWVRLFLEFGLNYRGEIIDEMTLSAVDEFLFEHVPRKVSTEPERAASIVLELTKFWEYVDRVFKLPAASSIIDWLKSDEIVESLEAALSDSANFGMAKSFFMSGKSAGHDMTSEAGMAEFMAAYNQSIQSAAAPAPAPSPSRGSDSRERRVGRNDPCPCGSGKKFKKCCLRN